MSFISRSDDIFRRVIDRLNLKTDVRELVRVPSFILPVFQVDSLLRTPDITYDTITVTGVGNYTMLTVPNDEEWFVYAVEANATSGTFTISDILASMPGALMSIEKGSGTSIVSGIKSGFRLSPGWSMVIYADSHSVDGNLGLAMYCDIMKVRR